MKGYIKVTVLIILFVGLGLLPAMAGELDDFVNNLNIEARADRDGFRMRLSTEFGIASQRVGVVIGDVGSPGDAYMCLRVAKVLNMSHERVIAEFRKNKGKGWGVIAKNLGIKPGSREFHALKKRGVAGKPNKKTGKGKNKKK
ncbi:MAG: hypothetical protein JSV21_01160 [Nitrospirota bacterium]|nr:MAG: hypothetical protein JSV21_01160 [Nitrospirota bacterium]